MRLPEAFGNVVFITFDEGLELEIAQYNCLKNQEFPCL